MGVGSTIKLLRTADGVSQRDLAGRLGVTRAYLSQIENERREAGLPLLKVAARELNIPLFVLFAPADGATDSYADDIRRILSGLLAAKLTLSRGRGNATEGQEINRNAQT